ncbi:MAG: glycosyltransferase family 9 protein [Paludibacteraceae bacterium]|nr:glycosyltransferase family 9 protein [Paludibacteraceae bacterium]
MRYLIIRLTSLGNVAMSVPVIWSIAGLYPKNEFVFVGQKDLHDLFFGMPNVNYQSFNAEYRGAAKRGKELLKTIKAIYASTPFDTLIDLQADISTLLTRLWCHTKSIPVKTVDNVFFKQRLHIFSHGNTPAPPSMFETYAAALQKAGLKTDDRFISLPVNKNAAEYVHYTFGEKLDGEKWIGIAPFAKSASNMLPFRTTKSIIQHYASLRNCRVFLFGAGVVESEMLNQWSCIYDNVVSVAGMLSLGCELELMRQLDSMICMDSANQHLAALVGLHVITVWGGTAPSNGFCAWKQQETNFIEPARRLNCRPCTLNGRKRCRRKTFECLTRYTAQQIIDKNKI